MIDDEEGWEVVEDLSQFEAVAVFADGQCGENAASFETTKRSDMFLPSNLTETRPKRRISN